jgi:hypothetical protein
MLAITTTHARLKPATTPRTISDLYQDFERAIAAEKAVKSPPKDSEDLESRRENLRSPAHQKYERAMRRATAKSDKIAQCIVRTPALSATEATLKVRVALWATNDFSWKRLEDLDHCKDEDGEINALVSLRDDFLRVMDLYPRPAKPRAARGAATRRASKP